MAKTMWQTSVDNAISSGKSVDSIRKALSNNPLNRAVQNSALDYLNKLHPVSVAPTNTNVNTTSIQNNTPTPQPTYVAPSNPTPVASTPTPTPIQSGDYSIGQMADTNSMANKLDGTMNQYADNAKKTSADTENNARKFGQEASTITSQRDAEKLIRATNQEAELKNIKDTRESNVELRRKDADALLKKQDEIAAMNSNIAMADAGKSGLQLSQGDLTTIQNDIMGKYATNIANAMDFKNKTNMTLDEALTNTGLSIFSKQSEIDTFKNAVQDAKYAPILEAVKLASAGNQKAIDDVNTFYQAMTQKKVDSEFTGANIEEIISTKEKSFQEGSAQKKENLIAEDLKDVPGAAYIISQIATVINRYPGKSRTFIMGELANMAMAKSDAQAQMIQSIAQGKQISPEIKKLADNQTAGALNSGTQTTSGKTTQENIIEAANPAKVTNTVAPPAPTVTKPTTASTSTSEYKLNDANQKFIDTWKVRAKANPSVMQSAIKMLDSQLSSGAISTLQYNAIYKALKS